MSGWQEGWIHPSLHGARRKAEILDDAWDLQAEIEAAATEERDLVGAMLDYEKFFDLFDPELARHLFEKAGMPTQLCAQLSSIYSNLKRYFKVGGSYGAVIAQANGCPQGCSFSLFLANIYVSALFNFLEDKHPGVRLGAFIDDRNVRHKSADELASVLADVCRFDQAAGHTTNILKSAVFANTVDNRRKLKNINIDGNKPRNVLDETMVGHTILVKRTTTSATAKMNMRTEESIRRARYIARADLPQRQKRRLIETSVVLVAWCGCQWSVPRADLQTKAATAVVEALWGKRRQQRCREVVLAILHDPVKVDPAASMINRRIIDARRVMRKSADRLHCATRVWQLMTEMDATTRNKLVKGPVQGLMHAATAIGGQLNVDEKGFYFDFGDEEPPLHITEGFCSVFKRRVRERIRRTIFRSLNNRTVELGTQRDENPTTRKDVHGITDTVDILATMALSRGTLPKLPKCLNDFEFKDDPKRYSRENLWTQRNHAAIAGSLMAYDRLDKAGLCEGPRCHLCDHSKGDIDHIMWHCPLFEDSRQPYTGAIERYISEVNKTDSWRAERMRALLRTPCVKHCGIIPDDPVLCSSAIQPKEDRGTWLRRPREPQVGEERSTNGDHHDGQQFEEDKLMVFVDGSAYNSDDWRRARAGWGMYISPEHPLNAHGPLPGLKQTSYRAELAAVAHALTVVDRPVHVVSDCRSIVDDVEAILLGIETIDSEDNDLWDIVKTRVREKGQSNIGISWIKSHVDEEMAERLEQNQVFTRSQIRANDQADELAKKGAAAHQYIQRRHDAAEDRIVIGTLVQRLHAEVWSKFFPLHEDVQDWEDKHEEHYDQPLEMPPELREPEEEEGWEIELQEDRWRSQQPSQQPIDATWTAKQIGEKLKSRDYAWSLEDAEFADAYRMPTPERPFDHTPGAKAKIRGRGTVTTGIDASPTLLEALRWWFNKLRWTPHWRLRPVERPSHAYTVTYAELVIDFEAATAMTIPAEGWGAKAVKLASLLRSLARIYTIVEEGTLNATTWKQAFDPKPGYPSLTPLGAPRETGLARRPRWICRTTPCAIVANVWRCLRKTPQRTDESGKHRNSAIRSHTIDRTGFNESAKWKSGDELTVLELRAKAFQEYDEECDKWRRDFSRPVPIHPQQRGSTHAHLWGAREIIGESVSAAQLATRNNVENSLAEDDKVAVTKTASPNLPVLLTQPLAGSGTTTRYFVHGAVDVDCGPGPRRSMLVDTRPVFATDSSSSCGNATRPTIFTSLRQCSELPRPPEFTLQDGGTI